MNPICKFFVFSALVVTLSGGALVAQGHDDHRDDHRDDHHDNHAYVRHNEWRKGYRMNNNDWGRGERVDYRRYHLAAPRPGYEWRQVDGNYVMAAVATGVIASVIAASAAH
jgi:Ni/Co efflux regulator RcnB